jgi:hypothetical protein
VADAATNAVCAEGATFALRVSAREGVAHAIHSRLGEHGLAGLIGGALCGLSLGHQASFSCGGRRFWGFSIFDFRFSI